MNKKSGLEFCANCRRECMYDTQKIVRKEVIRDKEYEFKFTTVICKECGEEIDVPGLIDLNIKERDIQFRQTEDIISIEEIKRLMSVYNIGKMPLALALGFGEVTVTRYLDGQVPSKPYSDIMKKALSSPKYMRDLLEKNRTKVGETAYKKAIKAIVEIDHLFNAVSDKMLISIAYMFEQMQEVTPLALQKMLYYIQGIYMVLYKEPLFPEECRAWLHGPVYNKVYDLFRDFKYNPIEDNRFIFLHGKAKVLSEEERRVLDLVIGSFGIYSGKTLEKITHNEKPWIDARQNYEEGEPSNEIMPKEAIGEYFNRISTVFDIGTNEGLNRYIQKMLTLA